jgi:hypothetical protein
LFIIYLQITETKFHIAILPKIVDNILNKHHSNPILSIKLIPENGMSFATACNPIGKNGAIIIRFQNRKFRFNETLIDFFVRLIDVNVIEKVLLIF